MDRFDDVDLEEKVQMDFLTQLIQETGFIEPDAIPFDVEVRPRRRRGRPRIVREVIDLKSTIDEEKKAERKLLRNPRTREAFRIIDTLLDEEEVTGDVEVRPRRRRGRPRIVRDVIDIGGTIEDEKKAVRTLLSNPRTREAFRIIDTLLDEEKAMEELDQIIAEAGITGDVKLRDDDVFEIRERKRRGRPRKVRAADVSITVTPDTTIATIYERVKGLRGQTVRIRVPKLEFDRTATLARKSGKLYTQLLQIFMVESDMTIFDQYFEEMAQTFTGLLRMPRLNLTFTVVRPIEGKRREQKFREGASHCIFNSILKWGHQRYSDCKGKNRLTRWKTFINNVNKYIVKYDTGLPIDKVQEVCDKLQVNISITMPLLEKNFIECKSRKKGLKTFTYINTRLNHAENYIARTDNIEHIEDPARMKEIFDNIDGYKVWTQSKRFYITSITTEDTKYILRSPYIDAVNDFEYKTGLNNIKICDIENMKLSIFVRQGVHYNTMINLKEDRNYDDITHIDMEKAYTNFHSCPMYEGFLGKITDFRKTNKIVGIGLYRIDNINYDDCDDKFKEIFLENDTMDVYMNKNVYTSPELLFLKQCGVKYDITEGAWGSRMHFIVPDEMKKKDDKNIPYYSRYFGSCNNNNLHTRIWMKGDVKFFHNLRSYSGVNKVFYDDYRKEGYLEYLKPKNRHTSHITAFITAYQRLSLYEQLWEYEMKDVLRIATDGIYSINDQPELRNVFRVQTKRMKKDLQGSTKYISGLEKGLQDLAEAEYREDYDNGEADDFYIELWKGAGGTGKTHTGLTDKGFIKILYVAPSWKLATEKKNKYNVDVNVYARLLSDDPDQINFFKRNYNIMLFDEISMLSKKAIDKLTKTYSQCKIILSGDVGFQLPAIKVDVDNQLSIEYLEDYVADYTKEYVKNYRIQDNKLLDLCNKVREIITNNHHYIHIKKLLHDTLPTINIEELKNIYTNEDMILSATNKRKDLFTNMFKGKNEKEKYYITNNMNCLYHTGDIVLSDQPVKSGEARHAFTTHSIQGETAEHKLFIDIKSMRTSQMIYTALSRARRLDQIYIIN